MSKLASILVSRPCSPAQVAVSLFAGAVGMDRRAADVASSVVYGGSACVRTDKGITLEISEDSRTLVNWSGTGSASPDEAAAYAVAIAEAASMARHCDAVMATLRDAGICRDEMSDEALREFGSEILFIIRALRD